jgi:hypothetical protein
MAARADLGDLAGVRGVGDAVFFHEGFQLAGQALHLLRGQAVEFLVERGDPFALQQLVHLGIAEGLDGGFGLEV